MTRRSQKDTSSELFFAKETSRNLERQKFFDFVKNLSDNSEPIPVTINKVEYLFIDENNIFGFKCTQAMLLAIQGFGHYEIANALNCAPSTVRNHLSRAYGILRKVHGIDEVNVVVLASLLIESSILIPTQNIVTQEKLLSELTKDDWLLLKYIDRGFYSHNIREILHISEDELHIRTTRLLKKMVSTFILESQLNKWKKGR